MLYKMKNPLIIKIQIKDIWMKQKKCKQYLKFIISLIIVIDLGVFFNSVLSILEIKDFLKYPMPLQTFAVMKDGRYTKL